MLCKVRGNILTFPARKRLDPFSRDRGQSPESDIHPGQLASHNKSRVRYGRDNIFERDGVSRRQAKRDRARDRHYGQSAGRLGKHVLHY